MAHRGFLVFFMIVSIKTFQSQQIYNDVEYHPINILKEFAFN